LCRTIDGNASKTALSLSHTFKKTTKEPGDQTLPIAMGDFTAGRFQIIRNKDPSKKSLAHLLLQLIEQLPLF
jgi:hypothetical protein